MSVFKQFFENSWNLTAEMAPYLILGFLIAGVLRFLFSEEWVQKHLGKRGLKQTLRAVIIGVPLPLCSCGIIPVAAGLRKQGAQKGAVSAFTAATPQTGIDSIFATAAILGWPFSILRVIIAFITGTIAGVLVDLFGGKEETEWSPDSNKTESKKTDDCCHSSETSSLSWYQKLREGLSFGLITLPRELAVALSVGILLAGVITTFAPPDLLNDLPGNQWMGYLIMTLISLPLYVCSTGSVPMAFAFISAGMTPGAVLIFLISGPATNVATVTALFKLIGRRSTFLYLGSIFLVSWVGAFLIDWSSISLLIKDTIHHHEMSVNAFQHITAVVLILILGSAYLVPLLKNKKNESNCCGGNDDDSEDSKKSCCCS